jgi:hypothetical protein
VSATPEQRFLEALRRLRARTDTLEELARWKEDLTSRLWRAEVTMRVTGEPLYDAKALANEVEMFIEVGKKWKEIE